MSNIEQIKTKLKEKGLKITPQRIAVLDALYTLHDHPTAEKIIDYIKTNYPSIAIGTVYNVLALLEKHQLIKRVHTENDVMRYDGITDTHHHLYCKETNIVKDYFDEELDKLLQEYFRKKKMPDFMIEEISVQIKGRINNSLKADKL